MGADNLIRSQKLFLGLTPWEKDEILKPFRWYYSKLRR
ncbi:hypothetical protein OCC_14425 [Thermococcus litoralis DSM 5473]|uniref:Uncharacterized protein n=1 Tax=Thermococcus litoralis (strain ATCC 51850 / DSM 5473 / JCM 8560 / NS-C) TaxID=523849 RepID=S5ZIM5_THELN|nr:hypothetical protein OCC_14425 [Thermococcus litoralis DSM 5473]